MLEGSHRQEAIKQDYGRRDVDAYCSNHADADQYATGEKWWNGVLNENPAELRAQLGGRWLTADYQLASEAVDERWIGPETVGHGPGGKRGVIC